MNVRKITFCISTLIFFTALITISAQEFKEFDQTFSINKDGKVSIETFKGGVTVETWDKAEIRVYAKMEPDNSSWECTDAEQQLEDVEIDVSSGSNYVNVRSDYYDRNSWSGCSTRAFVYYKIQMPKTVNLEIKDHKSDIIVTGLSSSLDINCYKGNIDIKGISGQIDFETYKGKAEIEFANLTGDSSFDTYKGEIDIYLPANSKFTLEADIEKKGEFDCAFDIDRNSSGWKYSKGLKFRDDINGGGSNVEVSTYKGEIEISKK